MVHRAVKSAERNLAAQIPAQPGDAGAAYLDVFQSLRRLLLEVEQQGYTVQVLTNAEELCHEVVDGNALLHGTDLSAKS